MLMVWDYFSGAVDGWRVEAKIRARRVVGDHPGSALDYVERRLARCGFASFERRRWSFIRRLVIEHEAAEEQRLRPIRRR